MFGICKSAWLYGIDVAMGWPVSLYVAGPWSGVYGQWSADQLPVAPTFCCSPKSVMLGTISSVLVQCDSVTLLLELTVSQACSANRVAFTI